MRESTLQKQIIDYMTGRGAYVVNNHGSSYSRKGVADLSICYKGKYIAVECKVGKNKLSEAQKIHIERLNRAGGVSIVPYTLDEFISEFERLTDE